LPGPIERVWAYLAESQLRRQCLAAGQMEMKSGTPFEFVWRNDELTNPPGQRPPGFGDERRMQSRIIEFDPPRKRAITWQGSSNVSFELEPKGNKVLLTVIHRRLPDRATLLKVGAGWAHAPRCAWSPARQASSRRHSGMAGTGCRRNTTGGCRPETFISLAELEPRRALSMPLLHLGRLDPRECRSRATVPRRACRGGRLKLGVSAQHPRCSGLLTGGVVPQLRLPGRTWMPDRHPARSRQIAASKFRPSPIAPDK
jgi:uncharacterized protein YndB with AHSA1/START domain